ncbi:MAG TPA: hypothetical protein VFP59_19660 [Candidatus Angelobacter sp.]|nr:hypothetical protein [Candidatus Angelobacter sp.]
MATTQRLEVPQSQNREFGFQVLKHSAADGKSAYTIGVWEEGGLRCICHAGSFATVMVALGREFEADRVQCTSGVEFPRWSEIADLVNRLENIGDADRKEAATRLADFHVRLHNITGQLEAARERLIMMGAILEEAAARSTALPDCSMVAIPQPEWFRLLGVYRVRQDGLQLYAELHALREIAGITAETLRTVDDWMGHASTREAAMDSLWRLRRLLERAGFKMPLQHLEWRGQVLRALEEAGLGIGPDGAIRVRQPSDKYWQPATGRLAREILRSA